jgi:squalene synthase HpnC
MSTAADFSSGKGSNDENFPVASHLVAPRHRPLILGFYAVARLADDVADHASASPDDKLARLDEIEASLLGKDDKVAESVALRLALAERGLEPTHALDLLTAFRRDVTQLRYRDWADLMDYCRYSAAPVGRFVLDVHGEARSTWPANDALCAALQVINHLQDCQKDYLALDRVYLPLDAIAAADAKVEMLGAKRSSPALLRVLAELTEMTAELLHASSRFAGQIQDLRLALEVGAIQRLAESLTERLRRRDPLSDKVHHSKIEALFEGLLGAGATFGARLTSRQAGPAGP